MKKYIAFLCLLIIFILSACQADFEMPVDTYELQINLNGSLQNPAWSPDGKQVVFTRFRNGYNQGPADIFIFDFDSQEIIELVNNQADNVNLPGSTWNSENHHIVFSSTISEHDEIFSIDTHNREAIPIQLTSREYQMAYEPSYSPDGEWIIFESHELDTEDGGVIMKVKLDGENQYIPLTPSNIDCRQPNWSPDGKHILYQAYNNQQWNIWIMDADGKNHHQLTSGPGDKTDASFSPDGQWIVFSADNPEIKFSELFIQSIFDSQAIQLTDYGIYVGAPSWSPDGNQIIFEASERDPDKTNGTELWVLDNLPTWK